MHYYRGSRHDATQPPDESPTLPLLRPRASCSPEAIVLFGRHRGWPVLLPRRLFFLTIFCVFSICFFTVRSSRSGEDSLFSSCSAFSVFAGEPFKVQTLQIHRIRLTHQTLWIYDTLFSSLSFSEVDFFLCIVVLDLAIFDEEPFRLTLTLCIFHISIYPHRSVLHRIYKLWPFEAFHRTPR
ncbi:unnamed protein product [Microthlaspi erraticum]|uniref:Transmembrane protein n=1 Tax=Microthlaspi erraticum TaxID=1685480 RepID=A0A6D2IWF5_9BRAS|nr:unnamed protein product [Microthlaspi erraticum]